MTYDAIIIGTGPAGGYAAIRLAQGGAKVLVLERHRLPRDKACGGGITAPAKALFDWDISPAIEARVRSTRSGLNFTGAYADMATEEILLVKRRSFDLHLIERALRLGGGNVTLNEGVTVERVEEAADGVTVTARTGERWHARFLIGADGAAGITARAIGMARRTRPGIALDADVIVPEDVYAAEAGRVTFEFDCLKHGYGWIFPKAGYLSCGVGSWSPAVRLPPALDRYLAAALPPGSIIEEVRRGHPIPLYDGPAPIGSRRVSLVGDAASLVDPILGEGIRFALWSGGIAADLLLEKLAGAAPLDGGDAYGRRIHAAFGAEFDRLRRFIQPIFFRSPALFFDRFMAQGGDYLALSRVLGAKMDAAPPQFLAADGAAASRRNVQSYR